ncbi:TfoX/Sxy family protein [Roseomonas sp. 18066]|uniref:TfoX/Sxy family protein n=1 Tax=Roseomonas sp. 18066 TaxID=2681412 RepID=UPI00135C5646|nr:TfoX/Sxy family protein [Roseomonas sp. 18066]
MAVSRSFLELVLGMLAPLGPVPHRAMFGGVALFQGERIFGIVTGGDRLFFRVDDQTRPRFEAAEAEPFTYATRRAGGTRVVALSYSAPPETMLDDPDEFLAWARLALAAAARAPVRSPVGAPVRARRKPR